MEVDGSLQLLSLEEIEHKADDSLQLLSLGDRKWNLMVVSNCYLQEIEHKADDSLQLLSLGDRTYKADESLQLETNMNQV